MADPVVLLSTGDVVGPNSSTDGTMVLFDGTTGKKVKGNNAVVTGQGLALLDDVDAAANRATIGLHLVNNTSDINKPVSTAQQAALDLKANIASPTFTGNPNAPTPPQFDNDGSMATTEFVRRTGVAYPGGIGITTTPYNIAKVDAGKWLEVQVAGAQVYLPTLTGAEYGAVAFTIKAQVECTVFAQSGQIMLTGGNNGQQSYLMRKGESMLFVAESNAWYGVLGGVPSAAFPATLATSGSQGFPSKFLIKFGNFQTSASTGVSVGFVSAFPNVCLGVVTQIVSTGNLYNTTLDGAPTAGGFVVSGYASGTRISVPGYYIAVGW